jgi:AbrB family looped-hinge helix DNA binding protein
MHNTYKVAISSDGRILIPSAVRKEIGVKPGDSLILHLDENKQVHILNIKSELATIQKFVKKNNPDKISLVDSLKESRGKDE